MKTGMVPGLSFQKPRFGGVRIKESDNGRSQSLEFQVFPDAFLKGVQYKDTINPSPASDELTRLGGDFKKNQCHQGNANLFNLAGDEPKRLTQLLKQVVDDSSLPEAHKTTYKTGLGFEYKRHIDPCYEDNIPGATSLTYPGLSINPRKPILNRYSINDDIPLEYAQQILASKPGNLEQHSAKGIARFIRRNHKEVSSYYFLVLAAAAVKEGKLAAYQKAFPEMKPAVEMSLMTANRLAMLPNLELFGPMLEQLGLSPDKVFESK